MSGTLDHVMIRIGGLKESLDWYTIHLGCEEKGRWKADTLINVYLDPEDLRREDAVFELTYNHGDSTYEMGGTQDRIAVHVLEDELESSYRQLMDEGVEDYHGPESCGGRYAFVKDPDGHEVKIVKRDHGAKWSLDHTMTRVEDADEVLGFWTRKFGYEHTGRWESDIFADYFIGPEDTTEEAMAVELACNHDGRSYEMDDAWGHLTVGADDLRDYWETLMEREAKNYRDPRSCDDMSALTEDSDGHEIEIIPVDFESSK